MSKMQTKRRTKMKKTEKEQKEYEKWEKRFESKILSDFDRFVWMENSKEKYSTKSVYQAMKKKGLKKKYTEDMIHKSLTKLRKQKFLQKGKKEKKENGKNKRKNNRQPTISSI